MLRWVEMLIMSQVTLQVIEEVPYLLHPDGWSPPPPWVEAILLDGVLSLWAPERVILGTADPCHLDVLRRSNSIFLACPTQGGMSIQGEAVIVA